MQNCSCNNKQITTLLNASEQMYATYDDTYVKNKLRNIQCLDADVVAFLNVIKRTSQVIESLQFNRKTSHRDMQIQKLQKAQRKLVLCEKELLSILLAEKATVHRTATIKRDPKALLLTAIENGWPQITKFLLTDLDTQTLESVSQTGKSLITRLAESTFPEFISILLMRGIKFWPPEYPKYRVLLDTFFKMRRVDLSVVIQIKDLFNEYIRSSPNETKVSFISKYVRAGMSEVPLKMIQAGFFDEEINDISGNFLCNVFDDAILDDEIAVALLQRVTNKDVLKQKNDDEETLLHLTILREFLKATETLIDFGVSLEEKNDDGEHPLQYILDDYLPKSWEPIALKILQSTKDIVTEYKSLSLLNLAIDAKFEKVAIELARRMHKEAPHLLRNSTLLRAAKYMSPGRHSITNELIKLGVDPCVQNAQGISPIALEQCKILGPLNDFPRVTEKDDIFILSKKAPSKHKGRHAQINKQEIVQKVESLVAQPKIRAFCIELLSETAATKSKETEERLEGRLQFLVDNDLSWLEKAATTFSGKLCAHGSLDQLLYLVKTEVYSKLLEVQEKYMHDTNQRHPFEDSGQHCESSFLLRVSELLLKNDGSLNTFFIKDCVELLLVCDDKMIFPRAEFTKRVLLELASSKELQDMFARQIIPAKNSVGEKIVRDTLAKERTAPISQKDVKITLLSGLISSWYQDDIGSCFATAQLLTAKSFTAGWILKDLQEIMEKGALTRSQNTYPALYEVDANGFVADKLDIGLKYSSVQKTITLLKESYPHVVRALTYSKDTEKQLIEKLQHSIEENTDSSCASLAFAGCEKTAPEFDRLIAASFHHPLLTTLENCIASMHYSPLTSPFRDMSFEQQQLQQALFLSLHKLSTDSSSIPVTPAIVQLEEVVSQAVQSNTTFDDPKFLETHEQLLQNAYRDIKTLDVFTDKKFSEFNKIHMLTVPQNEKFTSQLFYVDNDNIQPITTKEQFAQIAKELFFKCGYASIKDIQNSELITYFDFFYNLYQQKVRPDYYGKTYDLEIAEGIARLTNERNATNSILNSEISVYTTKKIISNYFNGLIQSKEIKEKRQRKNFLSILLNLAKKTSKSFKNVQKVTLPIRSSDHAFRFLPNDSSMQIPRGMSIKQWLLQKNKFFKSILIKECSLLIEEMLEKAEEELPNKWITEKSLSKKIERILSDVDQENIPLYKWLEAFKQAIKEFNKGKIPEGLDTTFLNTMFSKYKKLLKPLMIRFGDSNHIEDEDDKVSRVYFYYIFDGWNNRWNVFEKRRETLERENSFVVAETSKITSECRDQFIQREQNLKQPLMVNAIKPIEQSFIAQIKLWRSRKPIPEVQMVVEKATSLEDLKKHLLTLKKENIHFSQDIDILLELIKLKKKFNTIAHGANETGITELDALYLPNVYGFIEALTTQ